MISASWIRGWPHAVRPLPKPVDEAHGIELMVVLGGDGTILRGAEWVLASEIPLLGVNLGHIGFLAEAESSEIDSIVAADRATGRTRSRSGSPSR